MSERIFKTAWFAKAAVKARIADRALCTAIEQAARGQVDDLGGGVFKKRLNDNMYRSIILAKAGDILGCSPISSQKSDRANIDDDELQAFRRLADLYRRKTKADLEAEIKVGALVEICNGHDSAGLKSDAFEADS